MSELNELKRKLAACLKGDSPKPGYGERVEAIRARIAELEASNGG